MTPIKATDFLNHPHKLFRPRPRPVLDLREFNMAHAAPVENGHSFLTLRYDPATGALQPRKPQAAQ